MGTINIRRAVPEDAPAVAALFDAYRVFYGQESDLQAAEAFISARMERGESVLLLAEGGVAGEIVGFTQLYPTFSSVSMSRRWVLNDLYVASSSRGLGVGRLLLSAARDFAAASGAAGLQLETAVGNRAARALYESAGWKLQQAYCSYELDL